MYPKTSFFYPHTDYIHQETDAPEASDIGEQLVANVYMKTPKKGGELRLWLRIPTTEETKKIIEVEGLLPETIEEPRLRITPKSGDLIICSSRMLHAVSMAEDTHRVTMAAFIGVKTENNPLSLWS